MFVQISEAMSNSGNPFRVMGAAASMSQNATSTIPKIPTSEWTESLDATTTGCTGTAGLHLTNANVP